METTLTTDMPAEDAAEMESTIARLIEQFKEIREQMKADDLEIAWLKAENAVLKAESQTLREETRAILASLHKAA
jgi:cell division protein FtsB